MTAPGDPGVRRRLVIVRPEPGNTRTATAARRAGWRVDQMPLFAVRPLAWVPPDPAGFDALILTSANAVRHGGTGLAALRALPVLAVGEATASAAHRAGFTVALAGTADGAALAAEARRGGYQRLLHLAGREHRALADATVVPVYASEPLPPPDDIAGRLAEAVVLLHSPRAAARVAALAADRAATALAAISPAALAAAGPGWRASVAAEVPTDAALLAAAALLGSGD